MALCRLPVVLTRLYKDNFSLLRCLIPRHTSKSNSRNSHQTDALDIYTDNLLQETSNKWNYLVTSFITKRIKQSFVNEKCHSTEFLSKLSVDALQSKIIDSICENNITNVLFLIRFCKEKSYSLNCSFLIYITKIFARLGSKEGVETMQALYKISNETEFNKKCGLKHYGAQVLWYNGNIKEALEILESLQLNSLLKHDVNFIMYDIISSAVLKNEATLVLTREFAQKLVDKYNNYYPISILWKKLLESEWFADHQLAEQLLESNKKLAAIISPVIPIWCTQLLHQHKIDAVHKMCEVLLLNNNLDQYSSVLHSLFDYYYKQSNLKMCSAVVKSALELEIPLKETYQKRFLVLLTTGKQDDSKQRTIPAIIDKQIHFKF